LGKAEKALCKAIELSQKGNIESMAAGTSYYLGWGYFHLGEYKKAIEALKRCISLFEHKSLCPSHTNACKILIARIIKDKDLDLNNLFKWHGNIKNKWIGSFLKNGAKFS